MEILKDKVHTTQDNVHRWYFYTESSCLDPCQILPWTHFELSYGYCGYCSVVSDSLQSHGLQHARAPSLSPRACSNSCPLSQWCHPTISSPVIPFSSCPQSFPASGSFLVSQLFASGGQKYWSFSISTSPSNEYSGLISFRIDWLDLLAVWRTLKSLLQHHSSKASILQCSTFFMVQISQPDMTTGKTIALTRQTFIDRVMSLLFHKLSRFVTAFLPRNKCLLISRLQSPSEAILQPKKIKSVLDEPKVSSSMVQLILAHENWLYTALPTLNSAKSHQLAMREVFIASVSGP